MICPYICVHAVKSLWLPVKPRPRTLVDIKVFNRLAGKKDVLPTETVLEETRDTVAHFMGKTLNCARII